MVECRPSRDELQLCAVLVHAGHDCLPLIRARLADYPHGQTARSEPGPAGVGNMERAEREAVLLDPVEGHGDFERVVARGGEVRVFAGQLQRGVRG